MFSYIWKNRIKTLENKIAKMEQEEACAEGRHDWVMRDKDTPKPYIRCEHCYLFPVEKKHQINDLTIALLRDAYGIIEEYCPHVLTEDARGIAIQQFVDEPSSLAHQCLGEGFYENSFCFNRRFGDAFMRRRKGFR